MKMPGCPALNFRTSGPSYIPKDYRLENITLINHQLCNTFMLKHCGNYAAVLTNYVSFSHQKFSNHSPKDIICCRSQNSTTLVHSILISAGIGALSTFKILADSWWACFESITVLSGRRNTSWWTWCHMHRYSSCTHVIRNFFRENLY